MTKKKNVTIAKMIIDLIWNSYMTPESIAYILVLFEENQQILEFLCKLPADNKCSNL